MDGSSRLDQYRLMDDEISYHSNRALAELDQARRRDAAGDDPSAPGLA